MQLINIVILRIGLEKWYKQYQAERNAQVFYIVHVLAFVIII